MRLTKEKLRIVVWGSIALVVLVVYLSLFVPLIKTLGSKYRECKNCETDVIDARNLINSVRLQETMSAILTEDDVALAIDELTRLGKVKGIDFISMTPREKRKEKGASYGILPIEIETESGYKDLGIFLGSLAGLRDSLTTVSSFRITAHKKDDASKLRAKLVIDMYLLGEKYAE
jgi:Tfp pilus assembly protein PilO